VTELVKLTTLGLGESLSFNPIFFNIGDGWIVSSMAVYDPPYFAASLLERCNTLITDALSNLGRRESQTPMC